jgi:hypothetical protein
MGKVMFEKSLIPILKNDSTIVGLLSTYNSAAAVFSECAPEDAELPFAETIIQENSVGDSVVAQFTVSIDYYSSTESSVNARQFCQRVIELLDRREIENDDRYHRIRLFINNGPLRIDEGDPRDVHYSVQFSARAGRKMYIENYLDLTTEGE